MYPTLAPPQVSVSTNYVGANADTVEKAVTIPLEESINGVEGMRYISSSSTNSGTSSITTTFQTAGQSHLELCRTSGDTSCMRA
jgi:HAE1 family hydrophobic/amphiphilic exporter-1